MDARAFMDIQESNGKVPAHCWGKSLQDWTHWRWWTVWFYVSLHPHLGGAAQCQQIVSSWFLPWGKVRVCDWAHDFPGFVGHIEKAHFFLTSSKILSHKLYILVIDSCTGRTAAKVGNGTYQRGMDATNCFGDSIRKPTREPLGSTPVQVLLLPHGHH